MVPQSRNPRFLITRPAPGAAELAALLQAQGVAQEHMLLSPLLAPETRALVLPEGRFDGVILTSRAAVAALRAHGGRGALPLEAWCVGARTAQEAAALGFEVRSADGDARALAALIKAEASPHARLLHLRGRETREGLSALLHAQGIALEEAVIYAQEAQPLTVAAQKLLAEPAPVIVPLTSPRVAALFVAECAGMSLKARLHAPVLSATIAAQLPEGLAQVTIAARPDLMALLEASVQCYQALIRATDAAS